MRAGFTPRFRELLHRVDPALHLIAEAVKAHASDIKDTFDEWAAADSTAGLSPLQGGGVQLTENTANAIVQGSDDGTETDSLSSVPPFSALLIEWSGTHAEERELRTLVARLHPRPDGGSPKTVAKWRAGLYRVTVRGPEDDRIEVVELARDTVDAAGETASDVTFDFQGWSGAVPRVGPPPKYADRYDGSREGHSFTLVRVWALDAAGDTATNVAWMSDSGLGATISGAGYQVTHYTLSEYDTEKGANTVLSLDSTVAEMPRFTLNRSSYSAATITFSGGSNKPDLGAAPTGSVEIVAEGLAPGDSSITYELHDGSSWVECFDGDVVGEDNTAQGGADLSAVTPGQTLSMRVTLTPSSNTFLSPIVRRLGVRDITKTYLAGVAIVEKGGAWQVDPRTLKGNITKATIRILKTGEKDYLDYGTQILSAYHIGELELRVWVGDPTYQYLSRAEWMHIDSFEIEDYKNGNTAHVVECTSPLRRMRRKIPPFVATGPTEGTREPVEYLNQTIKAVAADLVDGQIGLPTRFVGPLIEDTTVVSKTIREADAKDELDRLAYLAGYGVITSQGRVKAVRMMRDGLGGDVAVATFLPGDYTPVDIGPGYAARVDEFFVPYGWDDETEAFEGEVRKFNATAFTRLGGQGLESSDRLDDEIAKWIPSLDMAKAVGERVPFHFANGQIVWAIRSTYRNPQLEPGDAVTIVTDQFVARSPISDREIKGPVAATGIVATVGDFWGQNLLVWIPHIDENIVAAEGTITRLKYVHPQIIQATVGFNESGECVFRAQVSDAASVRAALDTTSFPGRSTVQAATPQACDSDGWVEINLGGSFDVAANAFVSALPYENSDGTGAEGVTLWKKKVARGISEYIKPRVFPRASQIGSVGYLTLEADDPQSRITDMRVKTHTGGGDFDFETPDDGSWTDVSYVSV